MTNQRIDKFIAVIKQAAGKDARIERARSGLVNAVFLVDKRYVFRFPRDKKVYAQQVFERDVCSYLADYAEELPFGILKPVNNTLDHCFVYEYIPGETMSEQELNALSFDQQELFVHDLLQFIYWLGETLTPETYKEIIGRSKGKPIESWESYLKRTVAQFNSSKYQTLIELNQELLADMDRHYPHGLSAETNRVIHDDLHMGNLLFKRNKLSGVIDFGNVMVGDLACELRHFYRLSPALAEQAVEIYEQNYGEKTDYEKVAWWAKVNDAATLSEKIMAGKTGSPSYERALGNLAKWYPNKTWSFHSS